MLLRTDILKELNSYLKKFCQNLGMARYSIILPLRNGGEYLKDCVRSVLAQTYEDFNLVILENKSTDGSIEWLNSLNDKRIEIFPADKPLSIEENWKRILTVPKNEFMTFIGHDDLLDKNFLEVIDKLILRHPSATMYQTHCRIVDQNGRKLYSCKPMDEKQDVYEYLAFYFSGIADLLMGQVMRSTDYDEVGGLPPYPNLQFADLVLWIKLIRKGFRAASLFECCAKRIHESATTRSSEPLKLYHAFMAALLYLIELKKGDSKMSEVFDRYAPDFLNLYTKSISHFLLRVPKKHRENITVEKFVSQVKEKATILIGNDGFQPEKEFGIRLAGQIDSNGIFRNSFILFKKIYTKPVYK